jgi:hypothetical protein
MLEIDRSLSSPVDASPERCLELLRDVERYPDWSSLISRAEQDGEHVRLRASVLGVALWMTCELQVGSDGAVLRRIPHGDDDEERFEASFSLSPPGAVGLHVSAVVDAPGPARLIRGRVERALVDGLLADLVRAL